MVVNFRNAVPFGASVEVDYSGPVCRGAATTAVLPFQTSPSVEFARGINGIKLPAEHAALPSPTTVRLRVTQDATGRPDLRRGLREFVVGTGGAHLYAPKAIRPNSEVISSTFGVLKLTLKAQSYDWQFVPIPGKSFTDTGTAQCNTDPAVTETVLNR